MKWLKLYENFNEYFSEITQGELEKLLHTTPEETFIPSLVLSRLSYPATVVPNDNKTERNLPTLQGLINVIKKFDLPNGGRTWLVRDLESKLKEVLLDEDEVTYIDKLLVQKSKEYTELQFAFYWINPDITDKMSHLESADMIKGKVYRKGLTEEDTISKNNWLHRIHSTAHINIVRIESKSELSKPRPYDPSVFSSEYQRIAYEEEVEAKRQEELARIKAKEDKKKLVKSTPAIILDVIKVSDNFYIREKTAKSGVLPRAKNDMFWSFTGDVSRSYSNPTASTAWKLEGVYALKKFIESAMTKI